MARRDLGQTRVFGHAGHDTVVLGLRRRVFSDLYHHLVTGSWPKLCLVYALVYFLTEALLEVAHWGVGDAGRVAPGSLMGALVAMSNGAPAGEVIEALGPRAMLAGALSAVDGFVRWAELVIGAGIVMAKFSMQKAPVLFSKVAVVAPHAGGQALLFRMANQRRGHVVDARVSLLLVRNEREPDGEVVRRAHDLPLVRGGTALFEHAWTAVHELDRSSPLWGEDADTLGAADAELLVTFSGYDAQLLRPLHARHVYAARQLLWSSNFAPLATVLPDGRRAIDYRRFHEVVPAEATDTEEDRRPRRDRAG